jgi:hypothetical protein
MSAGLIGFKTLLQFLLIATYFKEKMYERNFDWLILENGYHTILNTSIKEHG